MEEFKDRPLHFAYAWPVKDPKRSKRVLPPPPFPEAEPWQCSVYYYWWEYLRRHEGRPRYGLCGYQPLDRSPCTQVSQYCSRVSTMMGFCFRPCTSHSVLKGASQVFLAHFIFHHHLHHVAILMPTPTSADDRALRAACFAARAAIAESMAACVPARTCT